MKMTDGKAALLALAISVALFAGIATSITLCWERYGFWLMLASWPFVLWGFWLGAMRVLTGKRRLE